MMDLTQTDLLKPAAKKSEQPSKSSPNCTTLFWHPAGPLVKYGDGILYIEDLNPQIETRWRMSRAEMFRLGWRFILAALSS
jgi:hypothetical protein